VRRPPSRRILDDRIADLVESNLTATPADSDYFEQWLDLYHQIASEYAITTPEESARDDHDDASGRPEGRGRPAASSRYAKGGRRREATGKSR
jgi:hypothetical protein